MSHLEYVQNAIAKIKEEKWDDESAHEMEDFLYFQILHWIADGSLSGEDAVECAQEAIKSTDIEFARWCA